MKVTPTAIPDVLVLEPKVFGDERGFFLEPYNKRAFREATGLDVEFVQDNHSRSKRGVLRGLHYQIRQPQGKLIRVVAGRIFDVAVDLRPGSATSRRWVGVELSADDRKVMYIPSWCAHGFCVLSDRAEVAYHTSAEYAPDCEAGVMWNDPALGIEWPVTRPLVSDRDRNWPPLVLPGSPTPAASGER